MTSPQGMDELFWGRDHEDVNDWAEGQDHEDINDWAEG
jgi:hypothetical protein